MLHKFPGPPATPTIPVISRAEALLMDDVALSSLLSRLASLLGHAVPSHRFGMVEHSADGVELAQLPRPQKAIEMWKARFASAPVHVLRADELDPGSFPLLWIAADGQDLRLVRGRLSHGACATENADGLAQDLDAAAVASGTLLQLRVSEDDSAQAQQDAPRSATDWFAFAIRRQRRIFMEAVFATFMISAIGLVSAMYTMQVYDRVVPSKGYATLWVLTIGALLGILLEFTLKQVRSYMTDRASKAIDQELSSVFFSKALDIRMDARPNTVGTRRDG